MDKTELQKVVLAALLHDIGKFAQRAGAPKSEDSVGYCPTDHSGRTTHSHVLYSDYFIEKILPLPAELDSGRLGDVRNRPWPITRNLIVTSAWFPPSRFPISSPRCGRKTGRER